MSSPDSRIHRRQLLAALASAPIAAAQTESVTPIPRKGRIRQCCFTRNFAPGTSLDVMLGTAVRLGAAGFDMLPVAQWPALKKAGLLPAMGVGGGVTVENGIIHKELHEATAKTLTAFIDTCAAAGCPNILISGGQRKGLSYTEGASNAV